MRKEFERLQEAVGTLEESKRDLHLAMCECWPIGRKATYRHGDNVIVVRILEHSRVGQYRLKVVNESTGREYWVCMYEFSKRTDHDDRQH